MADTLTPEKRSWNMSQIRGSETTVEVKVRKGLFKEGFRYRKNVKGLPGKPDIVLPKYKTIIFIHGCFWHRHENCSRATTPKSNLEYWTGKFARNVENDQKNKVLLEQMGWSVITLWECDINRRYEETMTRLIDEIKRQKRD